MTRAVDPTMSTEGTQSNEPRETDRTPVLLGVVALAIAALLHWMPIDADSAGVRAEQPGQATPHLAEHEPFE